MFPNWGFAPARFPILGRSTFPSAPRARLTDSRFAGNVLGSLPRAVGARAPPLRSLRLHRSRQAPPQPPPPPPFEPVMPRAALHSLRVASRSPEEAALSGGVGPAKVCKWPDPTEKRAGVGRG